MGKQLSYVFTLLVGLGLGLAVGTIARPKPPRGFRKPTVADVCRDLQSIRNQQLEDSTEAFKKGQITAGEKHEADAKHAEAAGKPPR